jgi:transketolase
VAQRRDYPVEREFPDRFFNVGIAEQALVDVAVGLAKSGKVPIANTFAFLFASRALEMVRTHLSYGRANVKLVGAYAGLSDSFDGPTHHSISDLAILRSLPNMTIVVPADAAGVRQLLPQVVEWDGPVFLRLNRNEVPDVFNEHYEPRIGKGVIVREGRDVTLVGCGAMVVQCLLAAEQLARDRIESRVVEIHTIKPLDQELLVRCAKETGALVCAEEHSTIGGLGGAVAEVLAEHCPVPLERVGIADTFTESGPYEALMEKYGLSSSAVVAAAIRAVERKTR